jgi:hypothetical protein
MTAATPGTVLAIDALDVTIPAAAIKAAGYVGCLHYLRNLTEDRCLKLLDAGLGVGTIFETIAAESLGGAGAGARDGQIAAAQMIGLGQPPGTLHAVNLADFKPSAGQIGAIGDYFAGYLAQTKTWQVLPYATGFVLKSLGVLGWQNAMDDNGVPGSVVVPTAVMYQDTQPTLTIPNASYDQDVVINPTLVNWWKKGTHMPSAPLPAGVEVLNTAITSVWTPTGLRVDAVMTGSNGSAYHKWYADGVGWSGPDVLNGAV